VAVGRHVWVPRRLFGNDQMHWRDVMGDYQAVVAAPDEPAADYPFTALSRWGSEDFTVRTVWQNGVRLTGHLTGFDGEVARLATDLAEVTRAADAFAETFVRRVAAFNGITAESAIEAALGSRWRPGELPQAPASLDLRKAGISTIIWATGYRQDFSWVQVPGALAPNGAPYQRAGVSPVPGLSWVGLHRMWEAAAGTVLGCGWCATSTAEAIAGRLAGHAEPAHPAGLEPAVAPGD
jgi:putative flavoprotein involved in K+ transport